SELNGMIEARDRGERVDFDGFMERYGDMFPDNPASLEELLEGMARRMAAMSNLMASLPPEQRQELSQLAQQVLGDMDLAFQADRLASHLSDLFPQTPRGARKLGERALVRVFERLKRDRESVHETREIGGQAEPTGGTRPWNFGDAGQIAVQRTVFNAVVRGGSGTAVTIVPEDFELVEAEKRTQTATALLLDLS